MYKRFVKKMFTVFGSTYICELFFHKRNNQKSKYAPRLTDVKLILTLLLKHFFLLNFR